MIVLEEINLDINDPGSIEIVEDIALEAVQFLEKAIKTGDYSPSCNTLIEIKYTLDRILSPDGYIIL